MSARGKSGDKTTVGEVPAANGVRRFKARATTKNTEPDDVAGTTTIRLAFNGSFMITSQEGNLIALLDEGNLEEFRRRLNAKKRERRRQMYARVISGD